MLKNLHAIENQYTTYLVDMVGVMYDGIHPFEGSIHAVKQLLKNSKQIIFLSNTPRQSVHVKNKLSAFGLFGDYHIVTSGDLMHHLLAHDLAQKNIYHLGHRQGSSLLQGIKLNLTSTLDHADAVLIACSAKTQKDIALFDDELEEIRKSQKPAYCSNPDQIAFNGAYTFFPSGYFANKLHLMGGNVIDLGKPSPLIYEFISQAHPHISINKSTALMIGDTLETDIQGATNFGVDSLLVLSGVTGLSVNKSNNFLQQFHYQPTYTMQALRY